MLSKSNYIRAATLIRREISGECLQTLLKKKGSVGLLCFQRENILSN